MRLAPAVLIAVCLLAAPVSAGHELPFYPSYYPQEIRLDTLDPAAAAAELGNNTLHAYVAADPFAGKPAPAHVQAVESLGSYLVLTWNPARAGQPRDARCVEARWLAGLWGPDAGEYRFHPYPVNPYHADYLGHVDRVEAARGEWSKRTPGIAGRLPRLDAVGARAKALRDRGAFESGAPEWTLEEVDADELVSRARTSVNGWLGPPWLKQGWFHAWLLQRDAVTDPAARTTIDGLFHQLTRGVYQGDVERLNLERALVERLSWGCERVVLGYATKREYHNAEFSGGVENIAWDSHAGFNSPIFLRTVKLKDFPWNGWLRLGAPARPTAAWNPIGGFTDPAGRLLWAALGDPAFFPAPYSASWIGNRTTVASVTGAPPARRVEVPRDALVPEGAGWREVGGGQFAATKVVYRVLASTFHDGSRMTLADTMYGLGFAYRSSPPLRDWLVAVRPVRVDATEREFADFKFVTTVQTIEAYGRHALADEQQTASIAAPWSVVPWPLLTLMERAAAHGVAAFSEAEARRRAIPWLDLVRDAKVRDRLGAFLNQGGALFPDMVRRWVTPQDARERWAALKRFYEKHGHFLVTNGPYLLEKWSDDSTVLAVFRDFSYPLGVGSYDRYPIPRRAYVTRIEPRGDGLTVHAEIEVVQKFMREYRIGREPLDRPSPDRDARDVPVCRYVVIGANGEVADAGVATHLSPGVFTLRLQGKLKPGAYAVALGLYLGDNAVEPEIKVVPWTS